MGNERLLVEKVTLERECVLLVKPDVSPDQLRQQERVAAVYLPSQLEC